MLIDYHIVSCCKLQIHAISAIHAILFKQENCYQNMTSVRKFYISKSVKKYVPQPLCSSKSYYYEKFDKTPYFPPAPNSQTKTLCQDIYLPPRPK